VIGRRWLCHIVGLIDCAFGIVIILFTRGHPKAYEYAIVNSGERAVESDVPRRERFIILWENLKVVVADGDFWLCSARSSVVNELFKSLTSGGADISDAPIS
jgi:hypothetical protein